MNVLCFLSQLDLGVFSHNQEDAGVDQSSCLGQKNRVVSSSLTLSQFEEPCSGRE